ncbi:kelch repeat-containing protein [Paludibaculum fermentans]|uniref:Kelch repeat-containing protein n=1 Tax=Paludibaculum fermentans TaxID=1473598 RepID=UPI003EBA5B63
MPVRRPSLSHLLSCAPFPQALARVRRRALLVFMFAGALIPPAAADNWNWRATALLKQARSGACAVRMADERVLVTGGTAEAALSSVEIYQFVPEERFAEAAPMNAARSSHGCALVKDGRVLVAGGGAAGIELYEPSLDTWTSFDSTVLRAEGTTVTPLSDGRVLILGGRASEVEVFDPDTSTISILPTALALRQRSSVTLLRDGRLLIAGGTGEDGTLNTAEILDADTGAVTALTLSMPRAEHSATALFDGRVLLAGGTDGASDLNTLDVWSPETNTFQLLGATLSVARRNHTALLSEANGFVLITSGSAASQPLGSSELFDPSSDSVQPAGSLTVARTDLAGVVLADGSILALGGRDDNGPSSACGVLPNPSFRPSQGTYHPLERALVSGSTGVSALNGRISFDLTQIDAGGKSIASNGRLISTFGTLVNGNLPSTPVVDLGCSDIGSTFVLTMRATVSPSQIISVQVRFNVKLRPTLVVTGLTGAVVAGQPIAVRTTLTADGGNVAFSGTLNLTTGGVTLSKSISATAASFSTENTICCPLAGKDTGASGIASLNATYGGNLFLEPASASASQVVVSAIPSMSLTFGAMRLATPSSLTLNVAPAGPDLTGLNLTIDPALRPTGEGTVKAANGTSSSAALQGPGAPVFSAVPLYPLSVAAFSYTPTIADRRSGFVCFDAAYSGDARYRRVAGLAVLPCAQVSGAPTGLQAVSPPGTFVVGTPSALTVRLTWPNSVGIVNRNVNVLADGRAAGTILLTPDPTGLGVAQGTANVLLPFNTRNLAFTYDQSGDLLSSQASVAVAMSPVSTAMTTRVAATVSNPFSIGYTLTVNNQGVTIPGGTSLGSGIELRENGALVQQLPVPTIPTGAAGTIVDGSSNTILPTSILVNGSITNLILPLGQHALTIRFPGSGLFQASEAQVTVRVQ